MQTRHECGVQGQLPPPEQGEPIRDHLQTSHVEWIRAGNIHVANEDVCGDARSALSTHAGSSTLHGKPTPSQNSRPGASFTVVATRVEWSATPAVTLSQREREAQAAQEQSAEERWFNARQSTIWAGGKCGTCTATALCSLSDMTESNSSRNWRSTLDEASCCHPILEHPGSLSSGS